jgi:hypothetical protein
MRPSQRVLRTIGLISILNGAAIQITLAIYAARGARTRGGGFVILALECYMFGLFLFMIYLYRRKLAEDQPIVPTVAAWIAWIITGLAALLAVLVALPS